MTAGWKLLSVRCVVHDRDFLFKCENVQLVILFCLPAATEAHDTTLACNTSIEASDSISWHRGKAFSRHSINDLLPISPWQTCQAFFLSLEKVARRENKEAFSVPAGIRVIRVVLVLPYKKKRSKNQSCRFYPLWNVWHQCVGKLISTSFRRLIHFGLWWCSCIEEYISLVRTG